MGCPSRLLESLWKADPVLASQITGKELDPEGPQKTALALETDNLQLRASLLEATERLEEMILEKEEDARLAQARRWLGRE